MGKPRWREPHGRDGCRHEGHGRRGERLGVDQSIVSRNMQNCNLAKLHTDLGEQWNEQGVPLVENLMHVHKVSFPRARGGECWTQREIGERLGVTQPQARSDINNCNLAKIYNDLGDQWNEQGVPDGQKKLL